MSAKTRPAATAALLYWLAVVAGLVGVSVVRALSPTIEWYALPEELGPLWIGTLAGVALGQLLSALRIRAWVPLAVLAMAAMGPGLWLWAVIDGALQYGDQRLLDAALVAFAPAALGGYLALSERGALVSFWFPAVLWMVALLDGPAALGSVDLRTAAPLLVGLGGVFVAFLRARETRRAAIWKTHAPTRVAETRKRAVLRASPVRALASHAITALVAAGALVVTAWVAPKLWHQEEVARKVAAAHARPPRGHLANQRARAWERGGGPCCASDDVAPVVTIRRRVDEYLPLLSGHEETSHVGALASPLAPRACVPCAAGAKAGVPGGEWDPGRGPGSDGVGDAYGYGYAYGTGSGNGGGVGAGDTEATGAPYGGTSYRAPSPEPSYGTTFPLGTADDHEPPRGKAGASSASTTASPSTSPTPAPQAAKSASTASTSTTNGATAKPATADTSSSSTTPEPIPAKTTATADATQGSFGAPWEWTFAGCLAAFASMLLWRAVRRAVVLRHLARPFWRETADQRISNHWHRVLVALRDAGIVPVGDEAPIAFAERVRLEGMATCAEILERARHGVGLEARDLETMSRAADAVYAAARKRAGVVARAFSWTRGSLA